VEGRGVVWAPRTLVAVTVWSMVIVVNFDFVDPIPDSRGSSNHLKSFVIMVEICFGVETIGE
jgi:hypothetical protein